MNLKYSLVSALALGLVFSACDKGSEPTTPPPTDGAVAQETGTEQDAAAPATEPGAPDVPWAEKTAKQRQEFMGVVVLPATKKLFKAYNETQYKGFKCQTCHGDDMNDTKFKMPSDSIYPLSKTDTIKASMDYDKEMTTFMLEQVLPETAKLLGTEPYDPKTGKGFSCFGCHPAEG